MIRDPAAVDGGELIAESSGVLGAGGVGEIEFTVSDVTGEAFQIQPHWFLLSYEPADTVLWGIVHWWYCPNDGDCWNADGTENPAGDWEWRQRAWAFGSNGSFLALLGLEGYSWWDGAKWRFRFQEAVAEDEAALAEVTWNASILRVDRVDEGGLDGQVPRFDRFRAVGEGEQRPFAPPPFNRPVGSSPDASPETAPIGPLQRPQLGSSRSR